MRNKYFFPFITTVCELSCLFSVSLKVSKNKADLWKEVWDFLQ